MAKLVKEIWNRKGRIKFDGEFLENAEVELMEQIMSNLIILRCEHGAMMNEFMVGAISRKFEEVPQNTIPPRYDIEVTRKDNDQYELNFEKCENEGVEIW